MDLISLANELLAKFGSQATIKDISECNHVYFRKIYEAMLGETLPGLNLTSETTEDEIHNIQVVIDSLATDVLGVDLSHIDAQSIVDKDPVQVQNLLEIFDGLLDYVLEEIEDDENEKRNEEILKDETRQNETIQSLEDSNIISADHEILSDVFHKEFGVNSQKSNRTDVLSPGKAFHKEVISEVKELDDMSHKSSDRFTWSKYDSYEKYSGNIIHTTDSTNELIREASLLEKQKNRLLADKRNATDLLESQKETKSFSKLHSENHWSSLLSQTSSAADSVSGLKEIGQRPRRKLPVEKQKEIRTSKRQVNVHKHMHHHYYHTDSSHTTTSGSPSPSSSTNTSQQTTPVKKKPEFIHTKDLHSTEIQTQNPSLVDSAVQTEFILANKNIGKVENLDHVLAEKSPGERECVSETRSKQLADLSARLQNIRRGLITTSNTDVGRPESSLDTNTPIFHFKSPTHVKASITTKRTFAKPHAKVSFATETEEHEFYSSDTEIDYGPTYTIQRTASQKPTQICEQLTDSSTSDSDELQVVRQNIGNSKSITARFEGPYLKRDERLVNLKRAFTLERRSNDENMYKLQGKYSKQYGVLAGKKKDIQKQSNLLNKQNKKTKIPTFDKTRLKNKRQPVENQANSHLNGVYGTRRDRDVAKIKSRKRSASSSPVRSSRRRKTPMVISEDDILPIMEEEFPSLYLSPHTAKLMWQKQIRQVDLLRRVAYPHKTTKTERRFEEAARKQALLTKIMKKELEHNDRLKEYKEIQDNETLVKRKLNERRHRSARARRYYAEYVIQNKARMLKKRSKEEKIFQRLFEDGLEIQKQRIQEMRQYAKEQREKNARIQQDEIDSLENYYRDQFSVLADTVAQERHDIQVRQKAQKEVINKMRLEMRRRMEKDINDIQEQLQHDDDSTYFRQLDADNLKREFQLATYKASQIR